MSAQEINSKCIDVTTELNDLTKNNFILFPNPVLNDLLISNTEKVSRIEIISIEGKILFQENYNFQSTINISMDKFSAGIYLIKVKSDNKGSYTYKVFKD